MRNIAVVTGSSGGIGAAICSALAADGFDVVAQYRRHGEQAQRVAEHVREQGVGCELVGADLATTRGIQELIGHVERLALSDASIRVRALVNNAGRLLGPSFDEITPETFDEYVAVNTKAPLFLTQGISRFMTSGAAVVNISSASAHIASAGDMVYAMTKSALESLTRNMAESLASRGIRVNAVVPGFTDNGHAAFSDQAALEYMGSMSVLGGVAEPHHVADAVSFLVSDRAARTTGALLDVTGGMTLHPRPHRARSVRDLL